jgi:hypothetical protein
MPTTFLFLLGLPKESYADVMTMTENNGIVATNTDNLRSTSHNDGSFEQEIHHNHPLLDFAIAEVNSENEVDGPFLEDTEQMMTEQGRRLGAASVFDVVPGKGFCTNGLGFQYDAVVFTSNFVAIDNAEAVMEFCTKPGMKPDYLVAINYAVRSDLKIGACYYQNSRGIVGLGSELPCPSGGTCKTTAPPGNNPRNLDYFYLDSSFVADGRAVGVTCAGVCGFLDTLECYEYSARQPWAESICFSLTSTVLTKNEKDGTIMSKSMEDLQVGDYVLTHGSETYEPVYARAHFHPTKITPFLQIHTTEGTSPLEVSPGHLIYVFGKNHPVPASMVKIGDMLVNGTSNGSMIVTKIETVHKNGFLAPLTPGGTIVVNGVLASTHHAVLKEETEYFEIFGYPVMNHHNLLNLALAPYHLVCGAGAGKTMSFCQNENHDDETGLTPFTMLGVLIRNLTDNMNTEWMKLFAFVGLIMLVALPMALISNLLIVLVSSSWNLERVGAFASTTALAAFVMYSLGKKWIQIPNNSNLLSKKN